MRGPTDPQRGGRHRWPAPIGGRPPKIAPRGGRLQIGTVADFKSEWWTGFRPEGWPTSNRKGWPACVGICKGATVLIGQ
jgi:hypothetical protein